MNLRSRAAVLALAASLPLAACGDSDEASTPATDPTTSVPPTTVAVDSISLEAVADPKAGVNLFVDTAGVETAPGGNYLLLSVNGGEASKFYNHAIHVDGLEPGEATLAVSLASADGEMVQGEDGEALSAETTITVPDLDHSGNGHSHGDGHDAMQPAAAPAPSLDLEVTENEHGGWDVSVEIENLELSPENASTDHVDGQGHLHLYVNDVKLSRLYGPYAHIPSLPEGEATIRVGAFTNDHRAYTDGGSPIEDAVTLGEPAQDDADGAVIELEIADGEAVGGVSREEIDLGSTVTLRVTGSLDGDEVHVHGYDVFATDDDPEITFDAVIPGVFEVELEGSHTLVMHLEVS